MVKVYTNGTGELKFYFGFGEDNNPPGGFEFLFEITDVMAATITASAILLMEAEMTYKNPGALELCRRSMVNFEEIGEHMAAYQLGQAVKNMLAGSVKACGTEAK